MTPLKCYCLEQFKKSHPDIHVESQRTPVSDLQQGRSYILVDLYYQDRTMDRCCHLQIRPNEAVKKVLFLHVNERNEYCFRDSTQENILSIQHPFMMDMVWLFEYAEDDYACK